MKLIKTETQRYLRYDSVTRGVRSAVCKDRALGPGRRTVLVHWSAVFHTLYGRRRLFAAMNRTSLRLGAVALLIGAKGLIWLTKVNEVTRKFPEMWMNKPITITYRDRFREFLKFRIYWKNSIFNITIPTLKPHQ